ncbi:MAG: methyltransferase domain-containing protein [Candidatus Omnitrophica bacterium]|nr:methyltransferase domain-containing protein [Candidatus Omnitrophota bacterium]
MKLALKNWELYVITFLLAACSIIYELLLAQTVSFFAANTVVWYSLGLGVFLGSMGLGALNYRRWFGEDDTRAALVRVEILLSLIGGLSIVVIHVTHMIIRYVWVNNNFFDLAWMFYLVVLAAVVKIGFLTGCELPLLINLGHQDNKGQRITNRILSIDYFGSLCGAVIFPLVLLSRFELITIGFVVGLINIMTALFLQKKLPKVVWRRAVIFVVILLMTGGLWQTRSISQYFLKKYYYYAQSAGSLGDLFAPMPKWPAVNRLSSPYQKIDLVYYPPEEDVFEELWAIYSGKFEKDPDFPKGVVLFMDGFFQFQLDTENINHEYFAHVPIIYNDKVPRKVLLLGGGDGLLLRELLQYQDVRTVTVVDIDPRMIEVARKDPVLRYANRNSLADPRVQVVIEDAYHFLRDNAEQYDAIYMDFPRVKDYDLSKLYSREFNSFVYRSLEDDGFAVFDASEIVDLYEDQYWEVYFSTMRAAGFQMVTPYFSTLEEDHARGIQLLAPMFDEKSQLRVTEESSAEVKVLSGREEIVKKILQDFVRDYQHSYVMVKKTDSPINFEYKTFGASYLILNAKRFALTSQRPVVLNDIPSAKLINSVERPTLPRKPRLWSLRVPY